MDKLIEELMKRKAVIDDDNETPRFGKWQKFRDGMGYEGYWCPLCKEEALRNSAEDPYFTNFCPNCGMDMRDAISPSGVNIVMLSTTDIRKLIAEKYDVNASNDVFIFVDEEKRIISGGGQLSERRAYKYSVSAGVFTKQDE